MDALTGALIAAGTAWASILLARAVPLERLLGRDGLRQIAAASLVIVALVILGVPLPGWGVWMALAAVTAAVALRARVAGADAGPQGRDAVP